MLYVEDMARLLGQPLQVKLVESLVGTLAVELTADLDPAHPEDERHHIVARAVGLQVGSGPDRVIRVVFCMVKGDRDVNGYAWSFRNGLRADSSRGDIRAAFGCPERTGGHWDRFVIPNLGIVHFQYKDETDGIDMITLMTPESAP
jgi:hypothetical protein